MRRVRQAEDEETTQVPKRNHYPETTPPFSWPACTSALWRKKGRFWRFLKESLRDRCPSILSQHILKNNLQQPRHSIQIRSCFEEKQDVSHWYRPSGRAGQLRLTYQSFLANLRILAGRQQDPRKTPLMLCANSFWEGESMTAEQRHGGRNSWALTSGSAESWELTSGSARTRQWAHWKGGPSSGSSNSAPSDPPPWTRPPLLILPELFTNWEPSIQTNEPSAAVLIQTTQEWGRRKRQTFRHTEGWDRVEGDASAPKSSERILDTVEQRVGLLYTAEQGGGVIAYR